MASMKDVEMKLVLISEERYDELLEIEKKLQALEAAGVDNWEGYPAFREEEEEE